jgi:hypothetical protein
VQIGRSNWARPDEVEVRNLALKQTMRGARHQAFVGRVEAIASEAEQQKRPEGDRPC